MQYHNQGLFPGAICSILRSAPLAVRTFLFVCRLFKSSTRVLEGVLPTSSARALTQSQARRQRSTTARRRRRTRPGELTWANFVVETGGRINAAGLHFLSKILPLEAKGTAGLTRRHGRAALRGISRALALQQATCLHRLPRRCNSDHQVEALISCLRTRVPVLVVLIMRQLFI